MKIINDFDIRQCDAVFVEAVNPRANIYILLNRLKFEKFDGEYFVTCTDREGVEFINALSYEKMVLFMWKYYKGCMCNVENALKSYPDLSYK